MIRLEGLAEAAERLARIDVAPAQRVALAEESTHIAEQVRLALSRSPGEDHAAPWLETGALRSSIASDSDESRAIIGSNSDVAIGQELGSRNLPPRPFLAPTAAAVAEGSVGRIVAAVARAIAGELA